MRLAQSLMAAVVVIVGTASAHAACGVFEVAKGDVKIQSGPKISAAALGAKICSGDSVITADQSRAKIKMDDGNELNVSPNSKIVLENYQYDPGQNKKKVLLNVLKGKIRATTREENMYNDKAKDGQANSFQVKTKSAVAGVRGTDFLTSFNAANGRTEIVTFRGRVEVGRLGPGGQILSAVQVGVGQTTVILMGKSPEAPKALPTIEFKEIETETKAPAPSAAVQPPPAAAPPSTISMTTDSELTGGTVAERGPASEIKIPGGVVNAPTVKQPPLPDLPQQAKDKIQRSTLIKIDVRVGNGTAPSVPLLPDVAR